MGLNRVPLRLAASAAAFGLVIAAGGLLPPAAKAGKMSAVIQRLGKICKSRVVDQFSVSQADAVVNLGATEKQGIDSGDTKMEDVKRGGLSFNWEIYGKKVNGYCNINYDGTITDFKQNL
ncbi:MAG: hypothetical protein ACKO3F_14410 [Cyanobium sp.]